MYGQYVMLKTEVSPAHVYIGSFDVWQRRKLGWPIMRVFAPHFVERAELRRYERELLDSGLWTDIVAVPRQDTAYPREQHLFDIYGIPR
jgi:hypothetical protein